MLTVANNSTETRPHAVLRAICVAGRRVEVGDVVQLTRAQALELSAAGKVSSQPVEQAAAQAQPAEPAPAKPRTKRTAG